MLCCFFVCKANSQDVYNDFSSWYWLQVKYNVNNKTTLNAQYQCRMNQNASSFSKSNLFFSVERKFTKSLSGELLYQFATNHFTDQYSFYGGLTYKIKVKAFILYIRSAVQHKRSYFTGQSRLDDPYFEWRNRFRIAYPIGNHWTFSLSTEPYLFFSSFKPTYFSRIRNVAQASYNLNKFHTLSVFYLVEPTLNSLYTSRNDYALGVTYQIIIPSKKKEAKNFFHFKSKEENQKPEKKDTFN